MAIHHARPGEVVDLKRAGPDATEDRTSAIVKSKFFQAIRLVVEADAEIAPHQVPGPITLQCLKGRVALGLDGSRIELSAGEWVYLEGGERHSVIGIEDAVVVLTIIFVPEGVKTAREDSEARALDARLDEGLAETFPASDPVAVYQAKPKRG